MCPPPFPDALGIFREKRANRLVPEKRFRKIILIYYALFLAEEKK